MSDINSTLNNKMENSTYLTVEEIHKLISSPVCTRIDITQNIAKYYKSGKYDESQLQIAEQIFRILIIDTEVIVRKSVAEAIKNIEGIPYSLITTLAKDIDEVSLPVLQFSDILSDVDLIDIISSTESEKQHLAISKRKKITEKVSEALIDTKNEKVVSSVIQNANAKISEVSYRKAFDNHGNSEIVLSSMIERGSLPVTIVERIAATISHDLYQKLSEKHSDSMQNFEEALKNGRDAATMKVMGLKSTDEEFSDFISLMKRLKISEEMFPIVALSMANLNLFEIAISRRTRVPVLNIRELLKDQSNQGFRAIYSRAALPRNFYDISVIIIDILRENQGKLNFNGTLRLTNDDANLLMKYILLKIAHKSQPENLAYILSLIKNNTKNA